MAQAETQKHHRYCHPERREGSKDFAGYDRTSGSFAALPPSPSLRRTGRMTEMRRRRTWQHAFSRGFSLIEVIIAVGLFATSVTVIIALLPALARQGGESTERLASQRLPDALTVELSRLRATGFDVLAGQVPVLAGPLSGGLAFVADRDVARLQARDYLPPATGQLAEAEQYFLVECWRFPDEPLRFDNQKAFLALTVRVSWPYRLPGATTPTAESARSQFVFTVSLNR